MSLIKLTRSTMPVIKGTRLSYGAKQAIGKGHTSQYQDAKTSQNTLMLIQNPGVLRTLRGMGRFIKKTGGIFKDPFQPAGLVMADGCLPDAVGKSQDKIPHVYQSQGAKGAPGAVSQSAFSFTIHENIRLADLEFAHFPEAITHYVDAKLNMAIYRGLKTEDQARKLQDSLMKGIFDVQRYAGKGGLFPDFKNVTKVDRKSSGQVTYDAEVKLPLIPNAQLSNRLEIKNIAGYPEVNVIEFQTEGISGPVKSMKGQWLIKAQRGEEGYEVILLHEGKLELHVVPNFVLNLFNQTKKVIQTLQILSERVSHGLNE